MAGIVLVLALGFYFCLPGNLFNEPYSSVLTDRDGQLLQAHISKDGQWRFPITDSLPQKYKQAVLLYEDRHFYKHPGVDVTALVRAFIQNTKAGKIRSGASTIHMQLIRLSRKKSSRNFFRKMVELVLAVRLECRYSKEDILKMYAGHAPFGGNVVGLNAAAWRYFGRNPHQLSWAEVATLAVLPNSPGLIHPGRNRIALKIKRNLLLDKLLMNKLIDAETHRLSKLEDIPQKPIAIPQLAPHLLNSIRSGKIETGQNPEQELKTTINVNIQKRITELLLRHHQRWKGNGIQNAAAMVMEVETGDVLAYVGNVFQPQNPEADSEVDVITAPRSPGSTLKPFLYEAMLNEGSILPKSLIPDVPTQISGYSPQNFDHGYAGAVPASLALSRSLNIPAVRMLQQYRTERFHARLKQLGIHTLTKSPGHYGLSLILGGGENTMWELAGLYASMGRVILRHRIHSNRYDPEDIHPPRMIHKKETSKKLEKLMPAYIFNSGSVYQTLEAMQEVMRPGEEMLWQQFNSAQRIAWKTGTSFGFRDGWAIGVTPLYVVAVWVGNADGEGRPGLIGVETAAPVLFDIFRTLPVSREWFPLPSSEMHKISVCQRSGHRAGEGCKPLDSAWVCKAGLTSTVCPYHQQIHLDASRNYRVQSDCYPVDRMLHPFWFVLPPVMEWYFTSHNPDYKSIPPYAPGCEAGSALHAMEMIYPKKSNRIFIPVQLDGETGKCIFEVAHRQTKARIHWHLDQIFIGSTADFHQMALSPPPGKHQLILTDDAGERLEQGFEVIGH